MNGEADIIEIGTVTHYYNKLGVAIIALKIPLAVGDNILIKGPCTDFEQLIDSLQLERKNVARVEAGQNVGVKLFKQAKQNDIVYKKL